MYLISYLYKRIPTLNSFVDVLNTYKVCLCFKLFFVHNAIDLHISPSMGYSCNNDHKVFELGLEMRGRFIVNTLVNSAVG